MRSRVMKCTASSAHHAVRDGGQLVADALPKGEAAIDHPRRFAASRSGEVIAVADLAEATLQSDQLLLGPEPDGVGRLRPRVLRRTRQECSRVRSELLVLRLPVGVHLLPDLAL